MIIVLRGNSTDQEVEHVIDRIKELGFKAHLSRGELRTIIGVIGDESKLQAEPLLAIPGVEQVLPILKPFKLASREFNKTRHGRDGRQGQNRRRVVGHDRGAVRHREP